MPGYYGKMLRVYLLDDHDIVRRGLRDLVAPARDIQVVGEGSSAAEAMRQIPELEPDVMLLDVQLQDGTGVQVCRHVRSRHPAIRGLLLTSSGDDEALIAAILAGAAGYLVKLASSVEVLTALRRVGAGKSLFDPAERARMVELLSTRGDDTAGSSLTPAEQAVLTGVLEGQSDRAIAASLGVSPQQVSLHVGSLLDLFTGAHSPTPTSSPSSTGKHRRPVR